MNFEPPDCAPHQELGFEIATLQPVTASPSSALTLIVDDDVGFLMWLGDVFTELGYQAVPALHCRQALAMARRFDLPIANLVMNRELRGAERVVKMVTAANPDVRIVSICNSIVQPNWRETDPTDAPPRAVLRRPSPSEPISRSEWVEKIREILS